MTPQITPGLGVDRLTLGTAALANLFREIPDDVALDAIDAAWNAGVRRFDTAPKYGNSLGESRLGEALRDRDRNDYILSTKVGATLRAARPGESTDYVSTPPFVPVADFDPDAIDRGLAASLERLGTDRLDIVYLHDPYGHEFEAVRAAARLAELRDERVIGRIGVGTSDLTSILTLLGECDLDVVMLSSRLTLLDQSALDELIPLCDERGIEVVAAAVFNSGLLAHPSQGTFNYRETPAEVREQALALERACDELDLPLRAVALQYPQRFAAVAGVVIGPRSAEQVDDLVACQQLPVSESAWHRIDEVVGGPTNVGPESRTIEKRETTS